MSAASRSLAACSSASLARWNAGLPFGRAAARAADAHAIALKRRRIYILPTRFGVVFAAMVFAMLLGSLNYGASLGFALTFLLTGLGLVVMHHCHNNLLGTTIKFLGAAPVFAGRARPCHAPSCRRIVEFGRTIESFASKSVAAKMPRPGVFWQCRGFPGAAAVIGSLEKQDVCHGSESARLFRPSPMTA